LLSRLCERLAPIASHIGCNVKDKLAMQSMMRGMEYRALPVTAVSLWG
jgi:hypothetical protein